MIVASLLLVIAAAVTLLIGLLNREVIEWVYASIASCLLAGVLLTIGVLRSRPSRKPVLQSGGQGQAASWAGASQWGGDDEAQPAGGVLTRDEDSDTDETVRVTEGDDEPTRTDLPAPEPPGDAAWAPAEADTGELSDVRVVPPPPPPPPVAAEPTSAPVDEDDDVVVVPKPSARTEEAGPLTEPAAAAEDDAAKFEDALSPIAGVGPAKRKALREHFGSYGKLRAATPAQLAEVPGVSKTLAQRIHDALHS